MPCTPSPPASSEQANGFQFAGNFWQNFLGLNEKWFKDHSGNWFTLTPDGQLRPWHGGTRLGSVMATVDPTVWDDPQLLFVAELSDAAQAQLHQIEAQFGFHSNGNFWQNFLGRNEKWLQDKTGAWFVLTSDGSLRAWQGGRKIGDTVATVDAAVWNSPALLFGA